MLRAVDSLTLVLVVTVVVLAAGAAAAWRAWFRLGRVVDVALGRLGMARSRRQRRHEALPEGLDQVDRSLAQVEQEWMRVRTALHGVEMGVLMVDDQGRTTFVNPPAERFLGARYGEAVAEVRIEEVLDEVLAFRRPVVRDLDLYTPVRRVLRLRAVPLEDGVRSLGAVLYIEDLTERWRVDQVRRDFVANVSHELKTPLGALAVLAETLADNVDDPRVVERLAGRLAGEARRLGKLVEDLLDLSRLEAWEVPPEPLPLLEVLREALDRVAQVAERAGLELVAELAEEEILVPGDRRQLVTAVANLLDNAVKYTEPPGKVWLRAHRRDRLVVIEVEDEGAGIAPSHRERIFERFYRVDPSRSAARGGTGLGLSIVKHVVLNHRGSVHVESEEGKGSRFWIELPEFSHDG